MQPNRPVAQVFTGWAAINLIALIVLCVTPGGRVQAQTTYAAQTELPSEPGLHSLTLQHSGRTRSYLLYIPSAYRSAASLPVVFAFHGGGGNMQLQASDRYGLVDKAERAGFIVVFPNGFSRFPGGKLATWNAGSCCAQARDQGVDDVGYVRVLWATLAAQLSVDPQRVFATGMSNGAMMSYRLACEMADVFKAIAPVAGTDNTLQCQPSRPVSVLHIHAQDDDHVLFNGGAGEAAFKDPNKVADFVSVPETISRWTQRNQCTGAPQRVVSVPGAFCDAHTRCAGGSQVELCVTSAGGHSWPGGRKSRAGRGEASQAIQANDVMWDFFQRVSALGTAK